MSGALDALLGARVQRIDGPRPDLLALTLHGSELHGCLLLYAAPGRVRWGWVPERPRGAPASSFVRLLRKHLENGRLTELRVSDASGEIVVRRAEAEAILRLDGVGARLVLEAEGKAIASGPRRESRRAPPLARDLGALEACGAEIVEEAIEGAAAARASAIDRAIARRIAKLSRRMRAIEGDLARVEEAEPLRQRASLLLAHLRSIPDGATEAEVLDWHADPPAPVRIAIDPTRGPKGEAEALFRRARKIERGAEMAIARAEQTQREIGALAAITAALSDGAEDLDELERRAARLGARVERAPAQAGKPAERQPYRTFHGAGDRAILVGRSAADNDALTMRVARPHDHWLHARGTTGSHVVVPLSRGEDCPPDLLADAAHLAAHFSSARGETIVEVQHTPRRHVRKRRGSAPGAVTLDREKVLVLRVSAERLQRLLASEDHV